MKVAGINSSLWWEVVKKYADTEKKQATHTLLQDRGILKRSKSCRAVDDLVVENKQMRGRELVAVWRSMCGSWVAVALCAQTAALWNFFAKSVLWLWCWHFGFFSKSLCALYFEFTAHLTRTFYNNQTLKKTPFSTLEHLFVSSKVLDPKRPENIINLKILNYSLPLA